MQPTEPSTGTPDAAELSSALRALAGGDFSVRLSQGPGVDAEIAEIFNAFAERLGVLSSEIQRICREIGEDGQFGGQAEIEGAAGSWQEITLGVNRLAANLTGQLRFLSHVLTGMAMGDLEPQQGPPAAGEVARLFAIAGTLAGSVSAYHREVASLAGGSAAREGLAGPETWHFPDQAIRSVAGPVSVAASLNRLGVAAALRGDYVGARGLLEQSLHLGRQLESRGNPWWVAPSLEGFAALAAAQGQPERAVRLYAAASALRERAGRRLPPGTIEQNLAGARAGLGADVVESVWAEGRALAVEEMVAYALGGPERLNL